MASLASLRIPIWGESRAALEHAALRRDPVLRGEGVPRGDGAPVMLVPGFMAGDASLGVMARWLRDLGHRPCRARIRANVDCTTRTIERLEADLEELAARHGRRVTVIGQSRGGSMARIMAVRRPDLVERIVALGSPVCDQMAVHPLVRAQVVALGLLGSAGVPGLFTRECGLGECCELAREQVSGPFPGDVDFVAVYSRSDGIVDWRACLDPAARHVEVRSSHAGMAVNAEVYRAVAEALASRPPASAARAA
jgi:pimeloyl-ACP methyl ester carboxylesterase